MSSGKPSILERLGVWTVVKGLKSSYLAAILAAIFVLDLVLPDPILFADEIVLGIATVLLARWKGRRAEARQRESEMPKPPPKNITPTDQVSP